MLSQHLSVRSRSPRHADPGHDKTKCWTMHEVVEHIIKKKTAKREVSYSELLEENKVEYFVTHWWGPEFRHLVQALKQFAKGLGDGTSDPAFWICSFATNQHEVERGISLAFGPFNLALKACKRVVMVCDDDFATFSRAWCLYEAMRAFQLGLPHDLTTPAGCLTKLPARQQSLGLELRDVFQKLGHKVLQIDVANAKASKQEDKDRILQEIELVVGHEQLNLCFRSLFWEPASKFREATRTRGLGRTLCAAVLSTRDGPV